MLVLVNECCSIERESCKRIISHIGFTFYHTFILLYILSYLFINELTIVCFLNVTCRMHKLKKGKKQV